MPPRKKRITQYSDAEIDAALGVYALGAGRRATVVLMLKEAGLQHVSFETLRTWAYKRHKERYESIRSAVEASVRSRMADQHMRLAEMSAELAEEAIRLLRKRLDDPEEMETRDIAKILREAAGAADRHTKSNQLLSGKPTQVVEHKFDDIRRVLEERHGVRVVLKGEQAPQPERPALPAASD